MQTAFDRPKLVPWYAFPSRNQGPAGEKREINQTTNRERSRYQPPY